MYRILAADDEPMMRKGLKSLVDWASLGCELLEVAKDGEEVVRALEKQRPDILLCDIKMPYRSGIEVARWISERRFPVEMILLTAYADFSFAQQAIQFGVSDYVVKNGAMEDIVEAVRRCIGRIERRRKAPSDSPAALPAFLKSVLDGSVYAPEAILDGCERLNFRLRRFVLFTLEMALWDCDDSQTLRLTESVRKFLEDALDEAGRYLLPMGRERVCAILPGWTGERAELHCREFVETFRKLLGYDVYIGVSGVCQTASALPAAYEQSVLALDGRFFDRRREVYLWREAPEPDASTAPAIHAVGAAVAAGDERAAQNSLREMFRLQEEAHPSPRRVRNDGLLVLNACRKELRERNGLPADAEARLGQCRFFEDYQTLLASLTGQAARAVSEQLRGGPDLVSAALAYIDANFQNPITLAGIAAAADANPSYLSRVFKQRTGGSLTDTIQQKRMELARQLLAAGKLKIYEVAAAVGIEDTTYFSHIFRKYSGLSPREYQERARR